MILGYLATSELKTRCTLRHALLSAYGRKTCFRSIGIGVLTTDEEIEALPSLKPTRSPCFMGICKCYTTSSRWIRARPSLARMVPYLLDG